MVSVDSPVQEEVLRQLLSVDVASVERIGGGGNSRIFKVVCADSTQFAAKHYFQHPSDSRDRLGVEFSTLEFLWSNGLRCVPRPVLADREHQWAVYEWIDGGGIPGESVTAADVDSALGFLVEFQALAGSETGRQLPPASEACVSPAAMVANVRLRLDRLRAVDGAEAASAGLREFLDRQFAPLLETVAEGCRHRLSGPDRAYSTELPQGERTLSPSDFGFHNALRRADGKMVFLDFEYFGWDDPAKTVSDFLYHPAMDLPEWVKQRFVDGALCGFRASDALSARLAALYPIFGLKWCMIILNEFLREHRLRRDFAGANKQHLGAVLDRQLTKAKAMLARVKDEYEHFPYSR